MKDYDVYVEKLKEKTLITEKALNAGVIDNSYDTVPFGTVNSYSGHAIIEHNGQRLAAIGHACGRNAYDAVNGYIETVPLNSYIFRDEAINGEQVHIKWLWAFHENKKGYTPWVMSSDIPVEFNRISAPHSSLNEITFTPEKPKGFVSRKGVKVVILDNPNNLWVTNADKSVSKVVYIKHGYMAMKAEIVRR